MKIASGIRPVAENKVFDKNRKERELLSRIGQSDENALKELYLIYYSRLHRFVSQINSHCSIDEIINDVMYVVWQKSETYNGTCLPSTWIFGIAYNKARQSLRGTLRDMEESLDTMETESLQFGATDVGLKQVETSDLLEKAFKVLSPEQRAVVELTYFQGMSYQEIAVLMECSENTVKTRMFHARVKLSKNLQRMDTLPEHDIE